MIEQAQVMVFTPHPDYSEVGVTGTVARWTSEGKGVVYVVCTNGDNGLLPIVVPLVKLELPA